MKQRLLLLISIFLIVNFWGCGDDSKSEQKIETVLIVGTQTSEDFLETGEFVLTALPLDDDGEAILNSDIEVEVVIEFPIGITSQVSVGNVNEPSDKKLAVALSLDGSGSMNDNDPDYLRVSGARLFLEELNSLNREFEVATFAYEGNPFYPFYYTELLMNFSNNVDSLKLSLNKVQAYSGTPTYESLLEILNFIDSTKSETEYERAIILLSDGQPNTTTLQDSVFNFASNLEIPIHTIGLGPASDLDGNELYAVQEMKKIAIKTGGNYAGIDPNNIGSIDTIYTNFAISSAKGSLGFQVQLSGSGFDNLTTNDVVTGKIIVTSGGSTASGNFSFNP